MWNLTNKQLQESGFKEILYHIVDIFIILIFYLFKIPDRREE